MNDGAPQVALREWRRHLRAPRTWGALGAVAVALAILGPFGLNDLLTPPGRFAYWLAMTGGTYAAGLLANLWLERALPKRLPAAPRWVLGGLGTGLAVLPVVAALNLLTFGYWPDLAGWAVLVPQVFGLAFVVNTVFDLLTPALPEAEPARPALLDRLPPPKRGPILSLSAQDHYTEVATEAGRELVLIRLADATREAAPTEGLKVHRSHWVAHAAIASARRDGDRAIVTLRSGAEIPVSRANVAALRQAGYL
ncbi:LytTR family DNA-binding domain-containing protein [Jannaschia formosa]|uniref:LytTR family DNA-binding domain-containing protein n=1 Tax=Jannaschia formosa TaxID=2259592 RepID=UPI0014302786|nr:LytTR family transcriptional regulator DNA-binding domain-containing protein [Jannaschia formosa]